MASKPLKFRKVAGTTGSYVGEAADGAYLAVIHRLEEGRWRWSSTVYGHPQAHGSSHTLYLAKRAVEQDFAYIEVSWQ